MSKQAVSVTLDRDNLLWLRARMRSQRRRSLSDTLDSIVSDARARLAGAADARRSVIGTIVIDDSDPDLGGADAAVREMYTQAAVATARPDGRGVKPRRRARTSRRA